MLDMGGGTGSNLEQLSDRIGRLSGVEIVDLCPSLLRVAQERITRKGWTNVHTTLADVTTYEPSGGPVDVITFSYSLTMIPSWFQAIDRAYALLRPGGVIGVTDFYIARKWPAPDMKKHSGFQRFFWPTWFGNDNVFPSPIICPICTGIRDSQARRARGKCALFTWFGGAVLHLPRPQTQPSLALVMERSPDRSMRATPNPCRQTQHLSPGPRPLKDAGSSWR